MCGIAGFLDSRRLTPDADRQIEMMLAALAHRGPDGHGRFVDRESSAVLGHVRLAINDLSQAGNQPLVSPDSRHVLVAAGEVYGFRQRVPSDTDPVDRAGREVHLEIRQ
jgi:asparagine synthase (glutamine-hydrolysing)